MAQTIRSRAVAFAKAEIIRPSTTDWQEVQDALSNHPEFGPWLGEDGMSEAQSIIRDAENSLGDKIPAGYSN